MTPKNEWTTVTPTEPGYYMVKTKAGYNAIWGLALMGSGLYLVEPKGVSGKALITDEFTRDEVQAWGPRIVFQENRTKPKTVLEIVYTHLQDNGYDGLYNGDIDCACLIDDLAPCGHIHEDCSAGYLSYTPGGDYEWVIKEDKHDT